MDTADTFIEIEAYMNKISMMACYISFLKICLFALFAFIVGYIWGNIVKMKHFDYKDKPSSKGEAK